MKSRKPGQLGFDMRMKLEEDSWGNVVLTFPDELMDELGWCEGDTLSWEASEADPKSMMLKNISKEDRLKLDKTGI